MNFTEKWAERDWQRKTGASVADILKWMAEK